MKPGVFHKNWAPDSLERFENLISYEPSDVLGLEFFNFERNRYDSDASCAKDGAYFVDFVCVAG